MPRIDFEVWCGRCGAGLCNATTVDGTELRVDPCCHCLSAEYDKGKEDGEEAVAEARSEGYEEGYQARVDEEVENEEETE